ncbi:MAG: RNA polymerase sigma factor, partial [Lachnospiraceae bacterium]|nr:RNA polymerase sigma factor [Lachnospiraceae bacterium]
MSKSLLRTDKEIAEIYERHKQTVYRVCFAYMKNPMDTEDAVQETFYRLIS